MAKRKKLPTAREIGGPYLATAVFCDNVLRGEDGAMTVVRIIDHITINLPADAPADVPSKDHAVGTHIQGLVSFRRGSAKPTHEVGFALISPSGERREVGTHQVTLNTEPQGGGNLKMNFALAITGPGVYWMDVLLNGKVVTKMPLHISINRAPPEPAPQGPERVPAKPKRKRAKKPF